MWYAKAYIDNVLLAKEVSDNREWFKAKYSEATHFKFIKVY
jgi:hypothetical protein